MNGIKKCKVCGHKALGMFLNLKSYQQKFLLFIDLINLINIIYNPFNVLNCFYFIFKKKLIIKFYFYFYYGISTT